MNRPKFFDDSLFDKDYYIIFNELKSNIVY